MTTEPAYSLLIDACSALLRLSEYYARNKDRYAAHQTALLMYKLRDFPRTPIKRPRKNDPNP